MALHWAAMSAFVCTQATAPAALRRGLLRIGGTITGAAVAVVLAPWLLYDMVASILVLMLAGFAAVDPRFLDAAATLRAGEMHTFWRVRLPLALPSLVAGVGMAWARALGEFGATITFAGNLAGTTRTVPLDVYLLLHEDLAAAATLSLLLIIMAAVLLAAMRQAGLGLFAPPRAPRFAPPRAR